MSKNSYSFSKLEMFSSCPLAFKLVHRDRIPRCESEALVIGSTVHQIVADYLNRLVLNGLQTDWEWAGHIDFLDVPQDVHEIWARFWNNFVLPPGIEAPGIEKKLAFTRAWEPTEFFAPDAYFRAVVDFTFRQGGLVVVQDWKTNRMVTEIEKNLQTRIYGWAVRRSLFPDAQEILLRLHFLRVLASLIYPVFRDGCLSILMASWVHLIPAVDTFWHRQGGSQGCIIFWPWLGCHAFKIFPAAVQALLQKPDHGAGGLGQPFLGRVDLAGARRVKKVPVERWAMPRQ